MDAPIAYAWLVLSFLMQITIGLGLCLAILALAVMLALLTSATIDFMRNGDDDV